MSSASDTHHRRSVRESSDARALSRSASTPSRHAAAHMGRSSFGGPGSTTTYVPETSMMHPGAVPIGGSTTAPRGMSACFSCARTMSASAIVARANRRVRAPTSSSASSLRSIGTPAAIATASMVRSSAVGPSPPVTTRRPRPSSICARIVAVRPPRGSPMTTILST